MGTARSVGIVSLGCPRNLVDSEAMLGLLRHHGFKIRDIEEGVDVAIVNTCSFIEDAKKESIDVILEASALKKEGRIRYLVVAGCLPQRYARELGKELPDVDCFIGTGDFVRLPEIIKTLNDTKRVVAVSPVPRGRYKTAGQRFPLTPAHFSYIKIAEGCANRCSYCVIPQIRGTLRSRTIGSVLDEVRRLTRTRGIRELNLIGQDTTLYGTDLYRRNALPELMKRICRMDTGVEWVRLLYTHPAHITRELIDVIAGEKKICKYLDIPVQHINDRILKMMNRPTTRSRIERLIRDARKNIPDVALRTSVIVGFPGESDRDFAELLDFIGKTRFERLGAFIYSREEQTAAFAFKDQVPQKEKERRFDEVMKVQQGLARQINKRLLTRELRVLVDERDGDILYGRTQWDAPEVDGSVTVRDGGMSVGEFYQVKVIDTLEYDLVATRVKQEAAAKGTRR